MSDKAFTLIELIVVLAIIALLAAIAVPNFMDAQVRAKVTRVKADFYTIAAAIEAYAVEECDYPPNDGFYNILPAELTTPVPYLSTRFMTDPFKTTDRDNRFDDLVRYYSYDRIVNYESALLLTQAGRPAPIEGVDHPFYNPGAFEKYGQWRLVSVGPDRVYQLPGHYPGCDLSDPDDRLGGIDVLYDPTNGTISGGNILKTQKRNLNAISR